MDTSTILVVLALLFIGYLLYTESQKHGHSMAEADEITPIPESVPVVSNSEDKPKQDTKVVLFFAPWCGHCKSVVPVWDSLAQKYKNVVKVDCDANPDIAQQEKVRGFPTIRAYVNNEAVEYQGDRSAASLEAFVSQYN